MMKFAYPSVMTHAPVLRKRWISHEDSQGRGLLTKSATCVKDLFHSAI